MVSIFTSYKRKKPHTAVNGMELYVGGDIPRFSFSSPQGGHSKAERWWPLHQKFTNGEKKGGKGGVPSLA